MWCISMQKVLPFSVGWVDWVNQSENDENEEAIRVEVHFEDGTEETFEKGITLRQIWHEDVL